jgi:hypothetical protein
MCLSYSDWMMDDGCFDGWLLDQRWTGDEERIECTRMVPPSRLGIFSPLKKCKVGSSDVTRT